MRIQQVIPVLIVATLFCINPASAQQTSAGAADKGWSSYSSFTETHDSSLGWSTILNSNVNYDFSRHFNSFIGVPIYFVQPSSSTSSSIGTTTNQTSGDYNAVGDVYLGMTYKAGGPLGYSGTILGTAPTGSTTHGISTGRATVDWNNHFEHDIWQLTPFIEAGFGNSNTAMNLGRRNGNPHTIGLLSYATLGPMLHFQGGTELSVSKSISVYVSGYDLAPLGNQKIYSRLLKRNQGAVVAAGKGNAKGALTQSAVTSGTSAIAVDRGFTTGLDFTPSKRVDLGFEFTRSATNAVNTVAFSIGYRLGHLAPSGTSK
jgi:hypothetical protein